MGELFRRVRPLVYVLWIVALARFVVDVKERPELDDPWTLVSVYYASILMLVWISVKRRLAGLSYPRMLAAFALVGVLCWAVPNSIAYTTAQFKEWTFGRFRPPRAEFVERNERDPEAKTAPIGADAFEKVRNGVLVGALTSLAGFGWTTICGTFLVYLPERLRRRRERSAADQSS